MPEHDIYWQQLVLLGHGRPLYEPDPAGRYDEIRIGDVGYIKDGAFHRLFNITRDFNDEINERGVPDDFESLDFSLDRATERRHPLPSGAMCSASVSSRRFGIGAASGPAIPLQAGASITLSCFSKLGAALITSHPSYRRDLKAEMMYKFERYMLKHRRSWAHFVRDRFGTSGRISVEDLVLVTGLDQTYQWATVVFTEEVREGGIEFKVGDNLGSTLGQAGISAWGSWSSNIFIPRRCGPIDAEPIEEREGSQARIENSEGHRAPSSPSYPYNQCVFLRGFHIRKRYRILPEVISAAAEGEGGENPDDDDYEPSSSSSVLSSTESIQIESIQDISGEEPQTDCDVYDVVARCIFENSDADVAFLHDKDICQLFGRHAVAIDTLEDFKAALRYDIRSGAVVKVNVIDGVKIGRGMLYPEERSGPSHHPPKAQTNEMNTHRKVVDKPIEPRQHQRPSPFIEVNAEGRLSESHLSINNPDRSRDSLISPGDPVDRSRDSLISPGDPVNRPGDSLFSPGDPVDRSRDSLISPGDPVNRPGDSLFSPRDPVDRSRDVYVSVDYEYLIWRGANDGQERIRTLPRPAREENLAAKVNDSP